MTPRVLPAQHGHTGLDLLFEPDPDADGSNMQSELSPTAMTITMVGEAETRWGSADVLARLAELAVTDELVVVCGSDEQMLGPSAQPVVAGLRDLLPRHTVVVLYVAPSNGPPGREAALLDELLELGSLPIVVAPPKAVPAVAAQLYDHLQADRVLNVSYTGTDGAKLQQLWHRRQAAGDHPAPCVGPTCCRPAA